MRVYGLDFTSAPKRGKPLTLAICRLDKAKLTVEDFHEFGTDNADDVRPLEGYADWLNGRGNKWKNEADWIAGIDFPFGMPIAAIARFGWGNAAGATNWESYVRQLYHTHKTLPDFKADIRDWSYPNEVSEAGNPIKIQSKRLTDQVARAQSAMKVTDNPYPGAMFYQGCKALLDADIHIPRLRTDATNTKCQKIAIEAYPRLVAHKFIPIEPAFSQLVAKKRDRIDTKKSTDESETETKKNLTAEIKSLSAKAKLSLRYKEARTNEVAQSNRRRIIDDLENADNPYRIQLSFQIDQQRDQCITDPKADLLDSVLCAVQAAWAYGLRENGFGIPCFDQHDLLRQQVALEGWIVDPSMVNVLGDAL